MTNRNDPCPCGSGKKFKKCCLNLQRQSELDENIQLNKWLEEDWKIGEANLAEYVKRNPTGDI